MISLAQHRGTLIHELDRRMTSGGKSGFEKLPTDRLNSVIAHGL